jgi:hypothetical protein
MRFTGETPDAEKQGPVEVASRLLVSCAVGRVGGHAWRERLGAVAPLGAGSVVWRADRRP